ncbi:uncharacterized protein A1O9_00580 [Exophiala aquamarina CBS 119918]|uniref:Uncharacterized protein n=1 Tax=Exophiala aquamarina CBS 119918 TaxID=1182545 RepID=A0A072PS62_9EURO|nr:uncharacterized protein A1O9_00580 [Exophiala aquamarina CBS 119918]KEF62607.1 hypothetical protein A1O9_00580 [Exophiala aquamarina CBS 119918]
MAGPLRRKYDAESGQVYSEMEIQLGRKQRSNWISDPRTPSLVKKAAMVNVGRGARSLTDTAKNQIASQFRNLTAEHFVNVPWSVAESLWQEVLERRAESFHGWRTLANAYPHAEEFGQRQYRYFMDVKQPQLSLLDYMTGITSAEPTWLTCLRISPKQLTTSELVSLHKITNLAVLDLSDGQVTIDNNQSTFDERVMRTWGELAMSREAFQYLRVFMFGWQENLSAWIFKYVDQFPSLCQIIVTDCPRMHQKNRSDWEDISKAVGWEGRHAKKSAKSLRPIIADPEFYFGTVSGCYYESMELFENLAASEATPAVTDPMPLLEISIGSPRQWSHVVEDFPSTRTIVFDNVKTGSWLESTKQQPFMIEHAHRDQTKRARNSDVVSPVGGLPPSKRGATAVRTMRRKHEKSVMDMLEEFRR